MRKLLAALCSLGLIAGVSAQALPAEQAYPQIEQQFAKLNLTVKAVSEGPMDNLLQVFTNRGLFFTSTDGRFFFEGNVYDLQSQQLVNEQQMRPYIKQQVAKASDGAIEYKAANEKYVITVFTDPTCGYCRKLHNEMKDYNKAGITVRYMAFPRGGLGSETYLQMQHIWCSKDSRTAMDEAKGGDKIAPAMCNNPVKSQYEMGQSFGINGTPAIILPNGRLIPGYQPAKALLSQLQAES